MKPASELTRVVLEFSLNLRLWVDVLAADASLRDSRDARDAQARLRKLGAAASEAAHQLAGVEVIDFESVKILLSYADAAERIAEGLPEGPHRDAVRSLGAQLRSAVERYAPAYV